jgi:glyoxylase-like metal-dependent hydrolase (beta-lactamase superfamily II)
MRLIGNFASNRGGVKWLFLTHRGGIGKQIAQIQENLGCQVLIQEQEAYLLPNLDLISFEQEFKLNPDCEVIWTPGHSPGSACLYYARHGGVLFTGRHLLPNREGKPAPLRIKKTFHWRRQLRSVKLLGARFSAETLSYICPGANTGYLRGQGYVTNPEIPFWSLNSTES